MKKESNTWRLNQLFERGTGSWTEEEKEWVLPLLQGLEVAYQLKKTFWESHGATISRLFLATDFDPDDLSAPEDYGYEPLNVGGEIFYYFLD